jgi:integrase
LRHTFGRLLIQDGASLAYVKEQMNHSSIQITVDTYGHLIPGADISRVDRLDSKITPQQSAAEAQPAQENVRVPNAAAPTATNHNAACCNKTPNS